MTQTAVLTERSEARPDHLSIVSTPTVAVVGLGYVGLPTSLALRHGGSVVIGIDVSPRRLEQIRNGRADLSDLDRDRLEKALETPEFRLTHDPSLIGEADAVLICVPTPVDEHTTPDLTILRSACQTVVVHARQGQIIVLTSTSYVGTTKDLLVEPLRDRGFVVGRDIFVAFAPERIDPGKLGHSNSDVPRVVGGVTAACTEAAVELLASFSPSVHPVSSPEAAEMTKLHENTFRAVNIALANEMADAARAYGLDPSEVVDAASTKPYGYMAFRAGAGVGGHCIPCDPHYLLWDLRKERVSLPLVSEAMTAIALRPGKVVQRTAEVLADGGKAVAGSRALVVGVTYKPGVEDVRESPALEIMDELKERGVHVDYHDPLVRSLDAGRGVTQLSVDAPDPAVYDIAIVITMHPDHDYTWLADCPRVLDTTYSLGNLSQRSTL